MNLWPVRDTGALTLVLTDWTDGVPTRKIHIRIHTQRSYTARTNWSWVTWLTEGRRAWSAGDGANAEARH